MYPKRLKRAAAAQHSRKAAPYRSGRVQTMHESTQATTRPGVERSSLLELSTPGYVRVRSTRPREARSDPERNLQCSGRFGCPPPPPLRLGLLLPNPSSRAPRAAGGWEEQCPLLCTISPTLPPATPSEQRVGAPKGRSDPKPNLQRSGRFRAGLRPERGSRVGAPKGRSVAAPKVAQTSGGRL